MIAIPIAAMAILVATAGPASAAQATGSCSSRGYSADAMVNYTTTGGTTYVTSYAWNIRGQSGSTQNNVYFELRRSVTGPDYALNAFASRSENNGYGYHTLTPRLSYPSSYVLFGRGQFIFDIDNAADPSCFAETARF